MPPLHSPLIVGLGALTPIGGDVWSSAAAARAGTAGFHEHPFMLDSAGEPMRVASVASLDLSLEGTERYAELLFPAINEAVRAFPSVGRVPLALGLPPSRPGRPNQLAVQLKQEIATRYAGRIDPVFSFECGHAAALQGLHLAMQWLATNNTPFFLVSGVDTYLHPLTLEWLEECDQLHGGGSLNNAWGFIPGEAAGALLIATHEAQEQNEAVAWSQVLGTALSHESNRIKTDSVCIGDGLTKVFRQAIQSLPEGERIDNVFCDMNGEAYRADEYGFAALRTKERFRSATDFIAPADCWGDVGAAGAPLHVALALASCVKGYGHGPVSLVWGSSEGGERGAALLKTPFNRRE